MDKYVALILEVNTSALILPMSARTGDGDGPMVRTATTIRRRSTIGADGLART